jgi:dCMP deaminase
VVTNSEKKLYVNFMREAYEFAALFSNDRSTKNGALLVEPFDMTIVASGANSFVEGFPNEDACNHERPQKYLITEHAERAAIFDAARRGVTTNGLIMVCPWACCTDCARAIALSGITKVIGHKQAADATPERWREEIRVGMRILEGSGVEFVALDAEIGGVENLFNGEVWTP